MIEPIPQPGGSTLRIHSTILVLALTSLTFIAIPTSRADWDEDGIPVVEHSVSARVPVRSADGDVVWVMWNNLKSGATVMMTKLTKEGNYEWSPSEVGVCYEDPGRAVATAITTGDVVAAWVDDRDGDYRIYAQKVDASGAPVWTPDGVQVSPGPEALEPRLVSDGADGAFLLLR